MCTIWNKWILTKLVQLSLKHLYKTSNTVQQYAPGLLNKNINLFSKVYLPVTLSSNF